MRAKPLLILLSVALLFAGAAVAYFAPHGVGRFFVRVLSKPWTGDGGPVVASDTSHDAEEGDEDAAAIALELVTVGKGLGQPTDIVFPPSMDGHAIVLDKRGKARWLKLDSGVHGVAFEVEVLTESEQGLLGIALHPGFADNGRFFLNYTIGTKGDHFSRVAEWRLGAPGKPPTVDDLKRRRAELVHVLMDVQQPYQNHNAGQLAFGPDGYLYIGWGDGGLRDDPHGHGQNPYTFLGSMLRIDVDARGTRGEPYAIPPDNPFVGRDGFQPEVWAYGLRNPWRYGFEDGRLVIADVGQNTWEEISIAQAGDNLGWKLREGFACFEKDPQKCARDDLVAPIFVYGRETGGSITGGYVYRGSAIPALRGHYVFGDFVSGRLMALKLPDDRTQRIDAAINLGKWPVLFSTFGRDPRGELYAAGFGRGEIYRLAPAAQAVDP